MKYRTMVVTVAWASAIAPAIVAGQASEAPKEGASASPDALVRTPEGIRRAGGEMKLPTTRPLSAQEKERLERLEGETQLSPQERLELLNLERRSRTLSAEEQQELIQLQREERRERRMESRERHEEAREERQELRNEGRKGAADDGRRTGPTTRPSDDAMSPAPSRDISPAPSRDISPAPSRDISPAPSRDISPAPSRDISPAPSH